MFTTEDYIDAEKELAELRGYHRIITNKEFPSHWFLTGDNPSNHAIDTAIPPWCRSAGAAMMLIDEYKVNIVYFGDYGISTRIEGDVQGIYHDIPDHETSLKCLQFAVVQCVIAKLKVN